MKRKLLIAACAAAASVFVLALVAYQGQQDAAQILAQARSAARTRNWEAVAGHAAALLKRNPADHEALLLAGEAAARRGRLTEAIRHYDAVTDAVGADAATARLCAGDARLQLGELTAAERSFREALELVPTNRLARSRLAFILVLAGRRWEARPHLMELVRREEATLGELVMVTDPARVATSREELERFRELAPGDPLPILGLAALSQFAEKSAEAERLLRSVVAAEPGLVEAQVQLGDVLSRRNDSGVFLSWHEQIPPKTEEHPQLWYVRGTFAASRGEGEAAARCFWETIRREPDHQAATYQLSQWLGRLGRKEEARRLAERARNLQRLAELINELHHEPGQINLIREVYLLTRGLGRLWEARAWLQVAASLDRQADWVFAERDFFMSSETWPAAQTAPDFAPTSFVDCASYPLPSWSSGPGATVASQDDLPATGVRFEVADAGIGFRYFSSPDPGTPGVRPIEYPGGGVGAFDYDADGRPDLYFTQGCRWPADPKQTEHLDRLYRNLGARFADSSKAAGVIEPGFSHGLACGDMDADGFPDVYIANIGPNRLFQNNGDGTFTDMSATSGVLDGALVETWTASAAAADLNSDGLPDLFDVNYLMGENVYERICGVDGVLRACSPTKFEGEPDRLLLNRGDGTFEDVTGIARIDGPRGTGLGVVVAAFEGNGRLSVFVANDAQNNHYYANAMPSPGGPPLFEERAILNGTAYDRDGRTQACMGIAAGDSDQDGRLDLFITNYVDESNTLYRQVASGLFADDSRPAGLTEPSMDKLGWGTQFLDADLDGREDLVVANGHIDDFTHNGYAYRMRPQLFHNLGGRFAEMSAESLGPYFAHERLGRGLARLDWNGDGRDDFAVSHLEDPAAVLTNVSAPTGRSFSLCLVATRSDRDAIGTTVEVRVGGKRLARQLTAGDGYAAHNERKLVFGLGAADHADNVTIRWPSGQTETFADLAAGSEWLVIESRGRLLRLERNPSREGVVEAGTEAG